MLEKRQLFCAALFASALIGVFTVAQEADPKEIISRSVEVNQRDWNEAPAYDYFQRETRGKSSRTYEIIMLEGSRYSRLVAVDDEPLSASDNLKEQQRFDEAVVQRQQESPEEREERIANYQKERERDHILMRELSKALDFTLIGQEKIGLKEVYVLKGKPRRGYRPPDKQAKALTGMQGTLWIDAATLHWVKVEAEIIRPIWIAGFFAQVQPGTRFELRQMPIAEGIWLPCHFSMEVRAKVLFLFSRNQRENNSYFGYHKSAGMTNATSATPNKSPRCF